MKERVELSAEEVDEIQLGIGEFLVSQKYRARAYDAGVIAYFPFGEGIEFIPFGEEPVVIDNSRARDERGRPILKVSVRKANGTNKSIDDLIRGVLRERYHVKMLHYTEHGGGVRVYHFFRI